MTKEPTTEPTETVDWSQKEFTERQILDASFESKVDQLINLTSVAAVNTAVEKMIEDWLIEELEATGVTVIEDYEVD